MYSYVRPPLNKKLFPVHRPDGLKRAGWNFFFRVFNLTSFFYPPPPLPPRTLISIKKEFRGGGGMPTSQQGFFGATRQTGNTFLPKDGLM